MTDIKNAELLTGFLPNKQLKLIQAWTILYEDELLENFNNLNGDSPTWKQIDPLQ
jgi:hypothetical protein